MTLLLLLRCHVYGAAPAAPTVKGYSGTSDALGDGAGSSDVLSDGAAGVDALAGHAATRDSPDGS